MTYLKHVSEKLSGDEYRHIILLKSSNECLIVLECLDYFLEHFLMKLSSNIREIPNGVLQCFRIDCMHHTFPWCQYPGRIFSSVRHSLGHVCEGNIEIKVKKVTF